MDNSKKKEQKDLAKIFAALTVIVQVIDDDNINVTGEFKEFCELIKEPYKIGLDILDEVYKEKDLSSSTFLNDMTEKFEFQFKKLYKL